MGLIQLCVTHLAAVVKTVMNLEDSAVLNEVLDVMAHQQRRVKEEAIREYFSGNEADSLVVIGIVACPCVQRRTGTIPDMAHHDLRTKISFGGGWFGRKIPPLISSTESVGQ
jgi:hypothetical protein